MNEDNFLARCMNETSLILVVRHYWKNYAFRATRNALTTEV